MLDYDQIVVSTARACGLLRLFAPSLLPQTQEGGVSLTANEEIHGESMSSAKETID